MTLDPTGNVGIGTANPSSKLYVKSDSNTRQGDIVVENLEEQSSINLVYSDKNPYWGGNVVYSMGSPGNYYWQNGAYAPNNPLYPNAFYIYQYKDKKGQKIDSGYRLMITDSGNIGVGTITPSQKLDVNGYIKSKGNITGDIVFQKNGETLWTMFEEENGLLIKSAKTGKTYKLLMEEVK